MWYDRFVPDSLWRNGIAAWIETTDIAIFRVVQGVVPPLVARVEEGSWRGVPNGAEEGCEGLDRSVQSRYE
jgi:hypothetical protein